MRNRGFTLLEVVLAIGLTGAVLGLLATAIDLYLARVDTSRTQVESAQLARTLLNQIADDLRAARYYSAASSSSEGGEAPDESTSGDASLVQGIFGTEIEIRIDRSAVWQWEHFARQIDVERADTVVSDTPLPSTMPQTVRYLLGDGEELLTAKLAAAGVSDRPLGEGYAGLYREQLATAVAMSQDSTLEPGLTGNLTADAELIAPEVVDITFAYFDGEQLLTEWDSSIGEGLPLGVEIRLTLLREPFEVAATRTPAQRVELRRNEENLVEYRQFVQLPPIREPRKASFPQPTSNSEAPSEP